MATAVATDSVAAAERRVELVEKVLEATQGTRSYFGRGSDVAKYKALLEAEKTFLVELKESEAAH